MVAPVMIKSTHPLYSVDDVFNGIYVRGNMLGEVMFYGKGAGKLPTASAVVADVVDAVKHKGKSIMTIWSEEKQEILPFDEAEHRFFVRIKDSEGIIEKAEAVFGKLEMIDAGIEGEHAFITEIMTEKEYREAAGRIQGIISMIRTDF